MGNKGIKTNKKWLLIPRCSKSDLLTIHAVTKTGRGNYVIHLEQNFNIRKTKPNSNTIISLETREVQILFKAFLWVLYVTKNTFD